MGDKKECREQVVQDRITPYETPKIEVIEMELEGIIAASGDYVSDGGGVSRTSRW